MSPLPCWPSDRRKPARDISRPALIALLTGHYSLPQVILETPRYRNLFIVPANADLADAALKISRRPTRLRRLLQDLPPDAFDLVLIDTGKGLDPLAVNALAAADEVIVMVTPGRLELDAIARMQEHVTLVREEVLLQAQYPGGARHPAHPGGSRTRSLAIRFYRLQSLYPGLVLRTIIPKNNDLQKAIGRARSIFEVAPDSKGSLAYQQLIEELGL